VRPGAGQGNKAESRQGQADEAEKVQPHTE
jgi:hypothetical protein